MPNNRQNWENKDHTPRVTFPHLAHHWSCDLDALTFPITDRAIQSLAWPFLPWHVTSHVVNSLEGGTGCGEWPHATPTQTLAQSVPEALTPGDDIWASVVFQLQARKSGKTRQTMPRWHQNQLHWLMTPCPGADQWVETMILGKLMNILLRSSPGTCTKISTLKSP